jgi:hypothetical protein
VSSLHELLVGEGYKLIDNAWSSHGRRTCIHDDNATREFIVALAKQLRRIGWKRDPNILRAFRHPITGELIEIEPGGADTTGNCLHHMKSE